MENQIIEIQNTIEMQNTVESFDARLMKMQKQLQIAIDTMQDVSRKIADNDDSLYSIAQTSKILGLSSHIIREEIKENKLKAIQRGSRNYVRKDDLNEYIKTN